MFGSGKSRKSRSTRPPSSGQNWRCRFTTVPAILEKPRLFVAEPTTDGRLKENAASARLAGTGVCVKRTAVTNVPETEAAIRYQENASAILVCMARPVRSPAIKDVVRRDAIRYQENASAILVFMAQPVKRPAAQVVLETEAAM